MALGYSRSAPPYSGAESCCYKAAGAWSARNEGFDPIGDYVFSREATSAAKNTSLRGSPSHKINPMSQQRKERRIGGGASRDELLLHLLKTPPQPRPKRERDKIVTSKGKKAKKTPAR